MRRQLLLALGGVALFPLAIILYGQYQLHQARLSEQWPLAPGRIVRSFVKSSSSENGTSYSADIKYAYTVQGVEHRSNVVVIGGHAYGANSAVKRYPLGKEVSVAYEPGKPGRAVLEPGVFHHGAQKLGKQLLVCILTVALVFTFLLRRLMQEEVNLLEKTLFVTCKTIFFPLTYCKGNVWVLAVVVGSAAGVMVIENDPVLTQYGGIFVGFYGLMLAVMLPLKFIDWLKSQRSQDGGGSGPGC